MGVLVWSRVAGACVLVAGLGVGGGLRGQDAGASAGGFAAPPPGPIVLSVDLRDAPKKILHAREVLPVRGAGPLTLVYPKWLPGEHAPTGPIADMAGFFITANGKPVRWERDPVDMYAYHVVVPEGVTRLEMTMDLLATAAAEGYSAGASTTANLAVLSWNELLVYPANTRAADVMVQPSVTVPEGWKFGTALAAERGAGDAERGRGAREIAAGGTPGGVAGQMEFRTVSLETLVDSPVMAGRWFREVALAPGVKPAHFLDIAADGPEDLEIAPEQVTMFGRLVSEAGAMFGSRHYASYHFLLALSDQIAHFGLEHHASSDDQLPEQFLTDDDRFLVDGNLLPHEFVHSWNGKFRRPKGLATPNYQVPMVGDLLWVYEGLTEYLGDVLACRSGIWSPELYRGHLAEVAADMDHRPGRRWRDLEDTARASQVLSSAGGGWDNWRRGTDYYPEGELLWLDVDTTIREKTHGKRSLRDFLETFYGADGKSGEATERVVPYTFDDVVAALNGVVANDWAGFLRERLDSHGDHAPLGGLEHGGYQLLYGENPNLFSREVEEVRETPNFMYSVGLRATRAGVISDVLKDGPSDKAGLGPGQTIVAVDGRAYTPNLMRQAIRQASGTGPAVELIVQNTGYYRVVRVEYHDGEKYPYLERTDGPARLDDILKPLAK